MLHEPGIKCPKCGNTGSFVIDSRGAFDMIRRRRVCDECKNRFTTYEFIPNTEETTEELSKQVNKVNKEINSLQSILDKLIKIRINYV